MLTALVPLVPLIASLTAQRASAVYPVVLGVALFPASQTFAAVRGPIVEAKQTTHVLHPCTLGARQNWKSLTMGDRECTSTLSRAHRSVGKSLSPLFPKAYNFFLSPDRSYVANLPQSTELIYSNFPFSTAHFLGHCFRPIPAPGSFAASAFPVPPEPHRRLP